MRNFISSATLVSLAVACSSSTVTQNDGTIDGGTQNTGAGSSVGGARTGTGGRTGTNAGFTSSGGRGTGLGGSNSTAASTTAAAGASNVGGSGVGGSTASTVHTVTGGKSGTGATGGMVTSGGTAAGGGGSKAVGGTSAVAFGGTSAVAFGGTSAVAVGGTSAVAVGGTSAVAVGGTSATGGVLTGGSLATGGSVATGGSTGTTCTGQTKLCNGACVPLATCCGGCSGDTPICSSGTCVGRPSGDTCNTGGECASKVCADGVCCNVACDGQCEACNLAATKGTCSPTTTARANKPCASDGSVCGGVCDGTAAHQKACVYPTNTTLCGPGASCNTSTNQASTAQVCNGSGVCSASVVKNCAPYSCNGTVCGTSCPSSGQGVCGGSCVDILGDPAHCGGSCTPCGSSAPKCYSGSCVQCTTGNDCATLGYGSGSVCTSNHNCQCHPPSAGNLLQNPGFDGSLSGWTIKNCPSGSCPSAVADYRGDYDYESCPGSGSVHLTYYGFEFGAATQCVPGQESKSYNIGYSYRQMSTSADALICYIDFFAGGTCSGSSLYGTSLKSGSVPFGTWSTALEKFFSPATTGSIQISCQSNSLYDAWIDQVVVNGSSGYF